MNLPVWLLRAFQLFTLPALLGTCCFPLLGHADENCIACHFNMTRGFSLGHAFGAKQCTICHGGKATFTEKSQAHLGLFAFPGNLSNATKTCGACHQDQVTSVRNGFMHSGKGMVRVTRKVFGEPVDCAGKDDLSHLGNTPADTLLKKLCASCHLGHDKQSHSLDAVKDRGGGCLACHINAYPPNAHPALSVKVSDARCFGCHSRSARISMNYAGLAEVEDNALKREDVSTLGRLQDGRLVKSKPADAHHKAGMSCIDCHTGRGLMGSAEGMLHQEEAVDISCRDCHANHSPRLHLDFWPQELSGFISRIPFEITSNRQFLITERFGTPLWNIEVNTEEDNDSEILYLHRKNGGGRIQIPQYSQQHHSLAQEHHRLTCEACHAQWAPQCYGCHLSFTSQRRQWDHTKARATPDRWVQRRWDFRQHLPTLGVTANNRIAPFIPGMILTIDHPTWDQPLFRRLFASTSTHTTGRSRSCESCHRSPLALGLGQNKLVHKEGRELVETNDDVLIDGLSADAWTGISRPRPGKGTRPGERSFTQAEIQRILEAELPSH